MFLKRLSFFVCFFLFLNWGNAQILEEINRLLDELQFSETTSIEKVNILNELGYNYWVVDSEQSLRYGQEALDLAVEQNYLEGVAMAKRVLGVAYWTLGEPKKALENLTESQRVYEQIGNEEGATNALMNSGMVYADIEEYPKALEIYNKSIETFSQLGLNSRIATTFTKIGTVLIEEKKWDEAKEYLTNALNMHSKDDFQYGQAEAHNRLGKLFLDTNDLELAQYHLRRAQEISQEIVDEDGMLSSNILMGRLLRMRQEYDQAEKILTAAYTTADAKRLKKYKLAVLRQLKLLRKEQGKLHEALELYNQFILLKDSIFSTTKSKQIAAMEFGNELALKQQEISFLKENERINNIIKWNLIISLIVLASLGFVVFRHQRLKSIKKQELLVQQKQLLRSKEELAKSDLENARLKQDQLKQELEFKNKELTAYTLNFVQKNELLLQLQEQINGIQQGNNSQKQLSELQRTLRQNVSIDRDWQDFRRFFEEVHSSFFVRLKDKHPDMSPNDLKLSALIRLNLSIKETASVLGISPESAKTARYRLRKKLDLQPEDALLDYFLRLEGSSEDNSTEKIS